MPRSCLGAKTPLPYLMYEKLTVSTGHAALYWILTIFNPSGRLILWRIRVAEFEFEAKYKKVKGNTHAEALSRLNVISKTMHHDGSDGIPVFAPELLNAELELNR